MNENARVANELRNAADGIAQSAVARDYARRPSLLARYGERGRALYLQDTRFHLSYLADAVSFGRPSIFLDYLGWLTEVLSARGVPTAELVENLKCLREVLVETLPADRAHVVLAVLDAGFAGVRGAGPETPGPAGESSQPEGLAKRYLDLLLRGERHLALKLVRDAVQAGMSPKEVWLRVFQDSQYEVGRLWQTNKITVAEEHYCSAVTQMIMSQLYSRVFVGPRKGRSVVTACAPGELHEIGIRMVADFFEMEGWDTYHLGANLPAAALVQFLAQRKPDTVALSAAMTFHLESIAEMVRAVRASQEAHGVTILVGGYAFNRETDLWRDIGADAYARDAEDAVTIAGRLVAREGS